MPAATRLNELAERKRALVLEADRCRDAIGAERLLVADHCARLRENFVVHGRWVGAAAVAGWLLPGSVGAVLRQVPALLERLRAPAPPFAGEPEPSSPGSIPGS